MNGRIGSRKEKREGNGRIVILSNEVTGSLGRFPDEMRWVMGRRGDQSCSKEGWQGGRVNAPVVDSRENAVEARSWCEIGALGLSVTGGDAS